jgi:hypothetical protein
LSTERGTQMNDFNTQSDGTAYDIETKVNNAWKVHRACAPKWLAEKLAHDLNKAGLVVRIVRVVRKTVNFYE